MKLTVLTGSLQKNQEKAMKKLLKTLKAYNIQEAEGAFLGFGCIRAKDYDKDVYGKLILWSVNIGKLKVIRKLFVRNIINKN